MKRTLNLKLLLSVEQEGTIAQKLREQHHISVYKLKRKELLVYGTSHTFDVNFDLTTKFNNFNPDIALIEGEVAVSKVSLNETSAARLFGESGQVIYLAQKHNIPVVSWDVTLNEQLENAFRRFQEDAILGWLIGQTYKHAVKRVKGKPIDSDVIFEFIKRYKLLYDYILSKVSITKLSPKNLDKVTKKYLSKDILQLNVEDAEQLASPRYKGKTNEVIRYLNKIRDEKAVVKIVSFLEEYDNVFVSAGKSHTITWEPVFRDYFDETFEMN